jgi:hypothetical protein
VLQIVAASTLVVLCATVAFLRGHHLFGIALVLIGGYELTGPLLLLLVDDSPLQAVELFANHASPGSIDSLSGFLLLFFILFISSYVACSLNNQAVIPPADDRRASTVLVFIPVILAFGLVSVATGAGEARLDDYAGEAREATRFFSYGASLFVVCVAIGLHQLGRHHWLGLTITFLCLAPLAVELFIAGRRQWFGPGALLVLLLLLYSRQRYKAALAGGVVLLTFWLFAIQYGFREDIQQGQQGTLMLPETLAVIGPQLGEFAAVGLISLNAWTRYVEDASASLTDGVHWLFHLLNTVPFVKAGDYLFPQYADALYDSYETIAPWGALSMLADAMMGFGWLGGPIVAILLGWLCHTAHTCARGYLQHGLVPGSPNAIFVLSLISVLLLKYRSGFGDVIQTTVSFSILYWCIVLSGWGARDLLLQSMRRNVQQDA